MTDKNRIVAVGLMTQSDVERLGNGFSRLFPVGDAGDFQGLLDAIDQAEGVRSHERVTAENKRPLQFTGK